MDHTQLKMTAVSLWGFVPEWTRPTMDKLLKRIVAAGTTPAVYLRTVAANKSVPGHSMRYEHVILSPKWDEFLADELQLMETEAKVKFDSDMLEFRNAMVVCQGNHREVLEDTNFNITSLGRARISLMYGFADIAKELQVKAQIDALSNPLLAKLYDKLQEGGHG